MDDRPIVVGGCHRSGTSLVRRMLDAHSRIHCGPELKFFEEFFGEYTHDPLADLRFFRAARSIVPESELLDLAGRMLVALHGRAAERAGKTRWADKSPENILHLGEWARVLGEEWVFLHVVRNPLDTLASVKELGLPRTLPRSLEDRMDRYVRCVEAGLAFSILHPARSVRVVYEELAAAPDAVWPAVMCALGESFEPAQLRFNAVPHQAGLEDPKVAHSDTVHDRSVGRWRHLLSAEEALRIRAVCGPAWRRLDPAARFDAVMT